MVQSVKLSNPVKSTESLPVEMGSHAQSSTPGECPKSDTNDDAASDPVEGEDAGLLSSMSGKVVPCVRHAGFESVEGEEVGFMSVRSNDMVTSTFPVTRSRHRTGSDSNGVGEFPMSWGAVHVLSAFHVAITEQSDSGHVVEAS